MMAARAFKLKPSKPPVLTEAQFSRQVRDALGYRGYVLVRNHVGTFVPYRVAMEALEILERGPQHMPAAVKHLGKSVIKSSQEGTADWVAVHPTQRTIWLELKRRNGKLRQAQERWLDYMIRVRGFLGGCFSDIDQLLAWFRSQEGR